MDGFFARGENTERARDERINSEKTRQRALLTDTPSLTRTEPHSPHHKLPRVPIHSAGGMVGGGKGHIERYIPPSPPPLVSISRSPDKSLVLVPITNKPERTQTHGLAWHLYWAV